MRPELIARLGALASQGVGIRTAALMRAAGRPPQRAPRPLSAVRNEATGRTVVRLYGPIGQSWWDDEAVSAADLARTLDTIGPDGIDLRINSGGGDAFDGIAMYTQLMEHSSDVVSYVDGIAASAASYIAMAGGEVVVSKPAKMMIHNARGVGWGVDKHEARQLADLLEEIDTTIAEVYADKSGVDTAEWLAYMDAETWFSAARAVEVGLADRMSNDRTVPAEDEPATEGGEGAPAPEDARTKEIRARYAGTSLALKG
jgi:ATP-dependent protease ClpP protease subunit